MTAGWQAQAVCAQVDDEIFFPVKGGNPAPAQRVCLGCPVRTDCLEFALEHDIEFGIWGGTTSTMRRRLRPAPAERVRVTHCQQQTCGKPFEHTGIRSRMYCSASCRQAAWAARRESA